MIKNGDYLYALHHCILYDVAGNKCLRCVDDMGMIIAGLGSSTSVRVLTCTKVHFFRVLACTLYLSFKSLYLYLHYEILGT